MNRGPGSTTRRPRRNGTRGFTLFEVVAAFVILAVSLIGIYQVWHGSLTRTEITTKQEFALHIAQTRMENALAERRFVAALQTGVQDGMDWTITTQAFA